MGILVHAFIHHYMKYAVNVGRLLSLTRAVKHIWALPFSTLLNISNHLIL